MSLSKEQVKHDRINLGRLVKRLENVVLEERWTQSNHARDERAWAKAHGMAQKIKYARQLLLNVDYYQELDPQTSVPTSSQQKYLQNLREALDRLDNIVDTLIPRLAPEPAPPSSYLSHVPTPMAVDEVSVLEPPHTESLPAAGLIPLNTRESPQSTSYPIDPMQDLLPSPPISDAMRAPPFSQPQGTSSLLSASLQTHEELSNELSRMATQLKRNAQHFSDSLDKDKSLIYSATEVLEKNYDSMTKERVRLKDHSSKSFGTTWMVYGALIAVSIAWVVMFLVIRIT